MVGEGRGSCLEARLGSAVTRNGLCGGVYGVGHTGTSGRLSARLGCRETGAAWFHEIMLLGDNNMFMVTV